MSIKILDTIWYNNQDDTIVVDVDGNEQLARLGRRAHSSDISPIEVSHTIVDILSTSLDPVEALVSISAVACFFGELYRRGVEIVPTKFLSAKGFGRGEGSGTLSY